MKKTIRILVPTYNEEANVEPLSNAIIEHFASELPDYEYFINFIDNKSTDNTREVLRRLCSENPRIKAIFNAKNFGQFNSPYYGLIADNIPKSDCTLAICADFQDPVEIIKDFVHKWEEGFQVVAGIKVKSKENFIVRFLRTCYYKFIKSLSTVNQLEHFTGFALYDDSFIETLRQVKDPTPFIRGLVAEYCGNLATVKYTQAKRRAGKTKNNMKTLYDAAMLSITTYTKTIPRMATIFGALFAGLFFCLTIGLFIANFFLSFIAFTYYMTTGIAFLSFMNLFFIGIVSEYIVNMNTRLLGRPLVVEQERINFEE